MFKVEKQIALLTLMIAGQNVRCQKIRNQVHHIPSTLRIIVMIREFGPQELGIEARDKENQEAINIVRVQHLRGWFIYLLSHKNSYFTYIFHKSFIDLIFEGLMAKPQQIDLSPTLLYAILKKSSLLAYSISIELVFVLSQCFLVIKIHPYSNYSKFPFLFI